MPKRARGDIHPRDAMMRHVAWERATVYTELLEPLLWKEPRQRESGVKACRRVTLTHHKSITIGPIGLSRPHVEYAAVKGSKDLGSREHGSDV
jgi:hypothetical protein